MARINIENSLFKDIRFYELTAKLGSMEFAIGALVRSWLLGQDYFLNEETHGKIPRSEWIKHRIKDEIIDVGLAESDGNFIRIMGDQLQFKFLRDQSNKGKNSAASKKAKKDLNHGQPRLTTVNQGQPLTLPLSLSPSEKEKNIYIRQSKIEEPPKEVGEVRKQVSECLAVWLQTIQTFNPSVKELSITSETQILRLVKSHGYEQTKLALAGARFEAKTERYDPAKHQSLNRFFKPNLFEKFMILGQTIPAKKEYSDAN